MIPERKVCSKCKEDKSRSEYTFRDKGKTKLQSRCKKCASQASSESLKNRFTPNEYNKKMSEYLKTESGALSRRKSKCRRAGLRGVEIDKAMAAFENSDGTCDICGKIPQESGNLHGLYIDHCHERMVFRGLLCNKCNLTIGLVQDDPVILTAAAEYVATR